VLVGASVLLVIVLTSTLFLDYLSAKRRMVALERELRDLYAREAELHTKLEQNEQRQALHEQQLITITSERDALARRLEEVERQLGIARGQRR
jgi:hypothetical protein